MTPPVSAPRRWPTTDFDLLLLTTTGRKSGLERTTPLGWVSDGNGGWLIAASANGAAGIPAWYHNLAAAPDKARFEILSRLPPRCPRTAIRLSLETAVGKDQRVGHSWFRGL